MTKPLPLLPIRLNQVLEAAAARAAGASPREQTRSTGAYLVFQLELTQRRLSMCIAHNAVPPEEVLLQLHTLLSDMRHVFRLSLDDTLAYHRALEADLKDAGVTPPNMGGSSSGG